MNSDTSGENKPYEHASDAGVKTPRDQENIVVPPVAPTSSVLIDPSEEEKSPKVRWQQVFLPHFLVIGLCGLIVSAVIASIIFVKIRSLHVENYLTNLDWRMNQTEQFLNLRVQEIISDIQLLKNEPEFKSFLEGDESAKGYIQHAFLALAEARDIYDQIRYIDQSGNEIVRVSFWTDEASIVPENRLQNKSQRYYFSESSQLPEGSIYFSRLDLNVEDGQIELPWKPMLRVATPVFNSAGDRRGILILNYMASSISGPNVFPDIVMLNEDGHWIEGGGKRWMAFLYGNKDTFATIHSEEIWEKIKTNRSGTFKFEGVPHTFRRLEIENPTDEKHGIVWYLVGQLNQDQLAMANLSALQTGLFIFTVSFLMMLTLAAIAAWSISRLRIAEAELKNKVIELKHATKMAEEMASRAEIANNAKSRFLANMSHEIRSPLNGIVGMIELLSLTDVDDEQRDYIKTIQESTKSLLSVVTDILDFTKIEAEKVEIEYRPTNLRQLMRHLHSLYMTLAEKQGIDFSIHVAPDVPEVVMVDETRLRQVIINLLSNALKFTKKGFVRVEVQNEGGDRQHCRVGFRISDSGIGMSEEQQARVFDMFTQADMTTTRRFGGTGLGLAICKNLVEIMKGTITVRSQEGVGSTFVFSIPLELASRIEEEEKKIEDLESLFTANILLVEDQITNQKVAKIMLSLFGCTVDVASNGKKAIDRVAVKPYDLVLMDCHMPVMDGLTATRQIRNLPVSYAKSVPIIAMTGDTTVEARNECFKAGMNGFVTKPITRQNLFQVLDTYCRELREKGTRAQKIDIDDFISRE